MTSRDDRVDPCIGRLDGVWSACCGHGNTRDAFVAFDNERLPTGGLRHGLHVRVSDIEERCITMEPAEAIGALYAWALTLPQPELDQPADLVRARRVADYLSTTADEVIGNPHRAYMRVISTREERHVTEFVAAAIAFAAERGISEEAFFDRLPEALATRIRKDGRQAYLTWHDVRSLTDAAAIADPGLLHYKLDPTDPETRRFRNAMIAASLLSYDAHRPVELRDYEAPDTLPA